MKQAGTPAPYLPVVDQKGNIKHLYYSQNAGHTFLEIFNGTASLNAAGRRQGFTALKDLYAIDPNPILKEKGIHEYRKYDIACKTKTVETEECEGAAPGTVKTRAVAFPEKWLPAEVRKRRAGTSAVSVAAYRPPELPDEPKPTKATKSG